MQNIHKHSGAQSVKVQVLRENDSVIMYIVDDGKGFDTSKSKKGIGLKNMNSRISDIEGEISFASEINKGTKVTIKFPYTTYTVNN